MKAKSAGIITNKVRNTEAELTSVLFKIKAAAYNGDAALRLHPSERLKYKKTAKELTKLGYKVKVAYGTDKVEYVSWYI